MCSNSLLFISWEAAEAKIKKSFQFEKKVNKHTVSCLIEGNSFFYFPWNSYLSFDTSKNKQSFHIAQLYF